MTNANGATEPNAVPNGTNGVHDTSRNANKTSSTSRFDPTFTQRCIDTTGPGASDRARVIVSSLFRHLHDFAREVELTTDEWMWGQQLLNEAGKLWGDSNGKRNEMHRLSDIFGVESLVDEMAHTIGAESDEMPTSSAILGPFWSPNAPWRELGSSIIQDKHEGLVTLMHGKVTDAETGKGIAGATVDVWQASSNGKYDFQDPDNQTDNNLRGKFKCNDEGEYYFYGLRPTAYSLPTDGPAGHILTLLDRHAMRPAHIHMMISAPEFRSCTTQIYPKDDPYLTTDTVFAVKDDLVVDFVPVEGKKTHVRDLTLNLSLAPKVGRRAVPVPTTNGHIV